MLRVRMALPCVARSTLLTHSLTHLTHFVGAASAAEGEPAHPRPDEAPSAPGGLIAHCMSRLDVPW